MKYDSHEIWFVDGTIDQSTGAPIGWFLEGIHNGEMMS